MQWIIYIPVEEAIKKQASIIKYSGGLAGVKNRGLLESVLAHIQNDSYYPTFEEKLTHLVFSINKNHAFNDGNKRSSIVLGAYFLELNGFEYCTNRFMIEMENMAVYVADNIFDKELLGNYIFSILNEDDYSEELKIRLIEQMDKNLSQE